MYIHIPKEKRKKLDPSGKKGTFVGYSKRLKAYRIYFPGFKKIDISRDITFTEDSTYNKSIKRPVEDSEETEVPRFQDTTMNDANQDEDREIEEPQELVIHPKRRILTRGNLHGYERKSKVQKGMGLQKKCT